MDLICSRPKWTVFFSVAVNKPIRDIICWTAQVGPVNNSLIFAVNDCHRSRVGLILPSFRLNW